MARSTTALLGFFLRHLGLIAAMVGSITALALGVFVYRGLYQTITEVQEVIELRTTVAVEDIDRDRLTAVRALLRAKGTLPILDPTKVRDIFSMPATLQPKRS